MCDKSVVNNDLNQRETTNVSSKKFSGVRLGGLGSHLIEPVLSIHWPGNWVSKNFPIAGTLCYLTERRD